MKPQQGAPDRPRQAERLQPFHPPPCQDALLPLFTSIEPNSDSTDQES